MTKSRNKQTIKKSIDSLSRPNLKVNLRGRLNENVTIVAGNEYDTTAAAAAGQTIGYGQVALAPGNATGRTNAPVQNVGRYFQKGLFLPGTFLRYIPSCGLNTTGNIIIAWIDNPDVIRAWNSVTPGNHLTFVRNIANAKVSPLWQEMTMPLTQAPRRKTFNIDPTIAFTTSDIDQSVQGFFVWCVYSAPAGTTVATTYGQLMVHTKCKFEEVKSFVVSD